MAKDAFAPAGSPYRPGFSQVPPVLAGRDNVLTVADRAIGAVADDSRTDRAIVLVGARGMGKTVLLEAIAERAAARLGAPRLHVEVTPGRPFVPAVVAQAGALVRLVEGQPRRARLRLSGAVLKAQVAGLGGEVQLQRPSPPASVGSDIGAALARLAEAVGPRASGFVLTLDEVQAARRDELAVVAAALQRGTSAHWPMVVAMAGLPSMRPSGPSSSGAQRGITYLERGHWINVEALGTESTIEALAEPAKRAGRPFEAAAAVHLAAQTGGYPYAVQVYGEHAWWASEGRDLIDRRAVERAIVEGREDLEAGLYGSRWSEASARERQYLAAVAELLARGERTTGGVVARRLGATTTAVSQYRERLLTKGTLLAEGGDRLLRFAVPGMVDFVIRQARAEGIALSSPGRPLPSDGPPSP